MPVVSFSRRDEEWLVRGEARRTGPYGELVLLREELPLVGAAELRRALNSKRAFDGVDSAEASVSLLPEAHFEADGPTEWVAFTLVGDQLAVSITTFVPWPDDGQEDPVVNAVEGLVRPLVTRQRATVQEVAVNDGWTGPLQIAVEIRIVGRWMGRTLAEVFELGEDVHRLCEAFADGQVNRETVADLVRGGGAHLLLDQPEGNWLDVKAEEYDLSTSAGKISLAQAVARFANGDEGGLVVIGAKAKKVPGGEIIRQVNGVKPRQNNTATRYLRVLDQHLYPPVLGIRIDEIPMGGELALIAIEVPVQPEESKPFLVHGAITATGDVEGSFISIVQRRGEGSVPVTAPMIHASIAAGRALLRGKSNGSGR